MRRYDKRFRPWIKWEEMKVELHFSDWLKETTFVHNGTESVSDPSKF